jgi:hypothetical protein
MWARRTKSPLEHRFRDRLDALMIRYCLVLSDRTRAATLRYLSSFASSSISDKLVEEFHCLPSHRDDRLTLTWPLAHQQPLSSPFSLHGQTRRWSTQASPAPSHSSKSSPDHHPSTSPFRSATVEVEIEAFEERYAAAAAQTVQDLIMLNFAPKVMGPIRPHSRPNDSSNLQFGGSLRGVSVNWKPSRFTLIRGPHIDKIGMEQFELRRFKRAVRGATHDASEVEWLLEHLKSVDFTGVEMKVHVTSFLDLDLSSSSSSSFPSTSSQPLFSQHMSMIPPRYLEPARAMLAINEETRRKGTVKETLSKLREAVSDGLEARLDSLASAAWFRKWRIDSGMGAPLPPLLDSEGIKDEGRKKAASFLMALDQVLLSVPLDDLHDSKPSLESIVEQIRFVTTTS